MTRWKLLYIVALVGLGMASVWWTDQFVRLNFKEVTAQAIADILVPLLVLATFLERAQEVFIKAWRSIGRSNLDKAQEGAKKALEAAKTPDEKKAAQATLDQVEDRLLAYKGETARLAFLVGATGGILIAMAGVRSLWPLIDQTELLPSEAQYRLFNSLDVFLTGGLLAGGSDGIHKVMTIITDGLTKMRSNLKNQPNPTPTPTP